MLKQPHAKILGIAFVLSLITGVIAPVGLTPAFGATKPAATPAVTIMYRLYNPNSGEHFYTSDVNERKNVLAAGWNDEGIGWYAPKVGQDVYRLYNKNGGEHHYTLSLAEKNNLVRVGWTYEGVGWKSAPAKGGVPLYRQYNPNAFANNHNYTTSSSEKNYLISLGWKDEKIGWYGVNYVKELEAQVAAAQKAYDSAKASAASAQAQFNQGSYGYFKQKGAKDAVVVFDNPSNKTKKSNKSVRLGAATDATNLDNMKASLEWIKYFNNLRKSIGLSQLEVSDYLMAVGQVQADWSDTNIAHADEYPVGENLAWGWSNPFDGWYNKEKAIYDAAKAKGETPAFSQVGHYLNIINKGYESTGFAISKEANMYGSITYEQSFGSGYSDSVDFNTYYNNFNAYYNKLKNQINAGDAAAKKLNDLKQQLEKAKVR